MDPFLAQIGRLCHGHPTRAKWVFVPSHAVGHTLGDRLVLAGTDWANLRFVTPLDVALRMGAPFLVERGIDPSEEGLGPALIMRLLLDLPPSEDYFRPLAHQPQIAVALWSTLRELRLADVRAADLVPAGFASPAKYAEVHGLLAAYEHFLEVNHRGDRQTVFREALAHPDWCPIQEADCWTTMPDVIWTPIERKLLDAMPGERVVPEALALPGLEVPRRLAETAVTRIDPATLNAPLAWLMTPEACPADARPSAVSDHAASAGGGRPLTSLDLFRSGGLEAEVEQVFERIVASGASLDDVEIAAASDRYAALIWEKACRYDWPVTLSVGLPVNVTRPGRALVGLSEWVEGDFAAGLLRRLLESGDVALGAGVPIGPARAARLLVRAEAAWGRQTYRRSLERLARSSRTRADRDDIADDEQEALRRRADEAVALADWIDRLLAEIPEPAADGHVDLQAIVSVALRFVAEHAARASALDAAAATALGGALEDLRQLGAFRCRSAQALRFLRERIEGLSVGADRARPGHLHVSTLAQAALAHRRQVFVVGLEEGRVFPGAHEDPILLDAERAAVSGDLRQSRDRIDEAVYAALARLAAASASGSAICLSYSCRDLRQFRETYASWVMLQAYRVLSGDARAPFRALHEHLGRPTSCVPATPEAALSEGRWWLQGMLRAGAAAGRRAVVARYPWLGAGIHAATERASDRFTEFDGYVPDAGSWLDPAAPDQVVSPTRLEALAKCPFRFFLERGLKVAAIDSGDRDRDVWLDPLIRGSLLHDLYARLLRRCRAASRRPSPTDDRSWLIAEGGRLLDELALDMPPPSVDVEARERGQLLEDLDLFLDSESGADPARTPVGFEVAFGLGEVVDGEPLASADPAVISAGGLTFRIAGRVDRIDRVDRSDGPNASGPSFHIVDYKTGRYFADDWRGTFGGGRMLQHALYGLAVSELLRRAGQTGTVTAAEYYFPAAKGRLTRRVIDAPPLAEVGAVLGDLREVVTSGLFVHATDQAPCKFCDLQHACGAQAGARASAKMADPRLEPRRRLDARA